MRCEWADELDVFSDVAVATGIGRGKKRRDGGPSEGLAGLAWPAFDTTLVGWDGWEVGIVTLSARSPRTTRFLTVLVATRGALDAGCVEKRGDRILEVVVGADDETRGRLGVIKLGCRTSRTILDQFGGDVGR